MLKMRLQRTGRKNDASFRVVVTDSRRGPKSGKHVDLIGSYNPKLNQFQIDGDKAKDWIAKGVQVSDTVHNLLVKNGVIEGKAVNVLPKKSPIISEQPEEEAPTAEESTDEAPAEETPAEESTPEETPAEEPKEEEAPAEEEKPTEEETPAEESSEETPKEEEKAE
ncbi:30S ribosomal protein S16 [Candidatus Kaiserbacteria bacterium]|nr:30S ribosomal protein S16 [Candidatus Kaiserbacteria bacterium]